MLVDTILVNKIDFDSRLQTLAKEYNPSFNLYFASKLKTVSLRVCLLFILGFCWLFSLNLTH